MIYLMGSFGYVTIALLIKTYLDWLDRRKNKEVSEANNVLAGLWVIFLPSVIGLMVVDAFNSKK